MEGNHAQMKPKVHFRACYTSMGIRGPTSRSKSAQAQEKTHFRQNQKQTQGSEGQTTSLTHLTFGEHPQANTGSPQGVHRPKMGPDGLIKGQAKENKKKRVEQARVSTQLVLNKYNTNYEALSLADSTALAFKFQQYFIKTNYYKLMNYHKPSYIIINQN